MPEPCRGYSRGSSYSEYCPDGLWHTSLGDVCYRFETEDGRDAWVRACNERFRHGDEHARRISRRDAERLYTLDFVEGEFGDGTGPDQWAFDRTGLPVMVCWHKKVVLRRAGYDVERRMS